MKQLLFFFFFPLYLISQEVVVDLHALGKIVYQFENDLCQKVIRLSPSGEMKYEHCYHYDNNKKLVSESLIGGLGTVEYFGSLEEGYISAKSPYGTETWSNKDECSYQETNIHQVYDEKGSLIQKDSYHYIYENQKLLSVHSDLLEVFFAYDSEGKKIAKKTVSENGEEEEYYLYLGKNEVGSISKNGNLKWLRIPGVTPHPNMVRAVAIETNDAIYAPIYDVHWNIVKLINIEDGIILQTRPDPFGQNLHELKGCPWTFCSKRYDKDIALVDFGYRYYDPELREWTAFDPLMQDSDPYRYCFDNPMQYLDPDGQFAIVIPVLTWTGAALTSPLWGPGALAIASGVAIGYLGDKAYKKYRQKKQKKKSPYVWDDLGWDPSKRPSKGFEWKGKGSPKSGKGNWVKGKKSTKEELHPDLEHPSPIGPHWDYHGPHFPNGIRIKPDSTWEHK